MGSVKASTCRVHGLSIGEPETTSGSGSIRQPDEDDSDPNDDDPLKEPPASTWIYTPEPGKTKRDWERSRVSKWLRLRFGMLLTM